MNNKIHYDKFYGLSKIYELSKAYSEKYPKYIKQVENKEDYSVLERELNELIKEMNELKDIYVQNNK